MSSTSLLRALVQILCALPDLIAGMHTLPPTHLPCILRAHTRHTYERGQHVGGTWWACFRSMVSHGEHVVVVSFPVGCETVSRMCGGKGEGK